MPIASAFTALTLLRASSILKMLENFDKLVICSRELPWELWSLPSASSEKLSLRGERAIYSSFEWHLGAGGWGGGGEIEPLTAPIHNAHAALSSILTPSFFWSDNSKTQTGHFSKDFLPFLSPRLFLPSLSLHLFLIFHYRLSKAKLKFSAFPSQGCYKKWQVRCCFAQGKTWLTLTQQISNPIQISDQL